MNFQMFKLDLEKAEEPEITMPTSVASLKKKKEKNAREFQKTSALLTMLNKAFDCVDHSQLWTILREMGIPDHCTCLLRNLYASQEATVRTRHGKTISKLKKEFVKAVHCHPTYLTYMQTESCQMLD